jgi:hypothetical protein
MSEAKDYPELEGIEFNNEGCVVSLLYPIMSLNEKKKTLKIRRMVTKDIRVIDNFKAGDVAKSVKMLARLTATPEDDIDKIDAKDFKRIQEAVDSFL